MSAHSMKAQAHASRARVVARMVAVVAERLSVRREDVVHVGSRLPDGSYLSGDVVDGRAVSVFGVPADKVEMARALGLTVEVAR